MNEEEEYVKSFAHFNVTGAGQVVLSNGTSGVCGQSGGFHLHVSWDGCSGAGGILGINEAKRLAEYILEKINQQPLTEEQIVANCYNSLK